MLHVNLFIDVNRQVPEQLVYVTVKLLGPLCAIGLHRSRIISEICDPSHFAVRTNQFSEQGDGLMSRPVWGQLTGTPPLAFSSIRCALTVRVQSERGLRSCDSTITILAFRV